MKTFLASVVVVAVACLCMYGLWSVRSFFYYDAGPVEDTVKELIKPECLK
jgi:hypothetical protein